MKKLFQFLMLPVAFLTITSGVRDVNSNAAPLGSTGAPGEQTCAKSGCHIGSAINAGKAQLSLDFGNAFNTYQPGAQYDITVSLQQPSINRFGFQVLALDDNGLNAGTLLVTDSPRTQTQEGLGPFAGRSYITYRYPGTNPYSNGLGQWSFKWKAPDNYNGNVTFYAAAVAANNDGTDAGDSVYTRELTVARGITGISPIAANALQLSAYPNPAHGFLNLKYSLTSSGNTTIRLGDIDGRSIVQTISRQDAAGEQLLSLNTQHITAGIYLLSITSGSSTQTQRVIIQ